MHNKFVQIFKEIMKRYGTAVCENLTLLNSLIADFAGSDFDKERKLLIWVLETNCHKALTPEYDFEEWKQEHIIKLNTEEFMNKEAAAQMLDIIFNVLFGESYCIERGFKLLENNYQQEAENVFNKAKELVPNSSMAFLGKGIIDLAREEYDNAIKYLLTAVKNNPELEKNTDIKLAEAYRKRGNKYKNLHNYKLAISDYEQANIYYTKLIDIEPNNITLIMYRAELYLQLEKYQAAINDYNEILINNNVLIAAHEKRSLAHFRLKNYDAALEDCQSILAIDQINSSAFYHSSLLFLEMLNFSKARENLDNAIRYDTTKELAEKTITLNQKIDFREAEYYEKLGDDYFSQNEPDNAIDAFSKSIEIMPNCGRLYFKRGNIYTKKDIMQLAKPDYQKGAELSTEPLEKFMASGFLDLIDKDYKGAVTNFLGAIKIDKNYKNYLNPYLAKAYVAEAINLLSSENFDAAIEYFNNAINIDTSFSGSILPSLFTAYCKKGDIEKNENKFDIAITSYKKALEITESNDIFIKLAQCYHGRSKFQDEIAVLDKLILAIPQNIDAYMMRAKAYTLLKNYNSALNDYNAVNKLDKKYIKSYLKCIQIFFIQKDYTALIDASLAILDIDPNNKEALYICNIYNKDAENMAILIEKREDWERTTSYVDITSFPFRCSNCLFYSDTTSTCTEMEKSKVFALTSDGSRCHQYKKENNTEAGEKQ